MTDHSLHVETIENVAETMRDTMADLTHHAEIEPPLGFNLTTPHLITLPEKRRTEDLTARHIAAAEFLRPLRRRGTARLSDLASIIAWANRFKSDHSALFANPDMQTPSLTCIADYHISGPATVDAEYGDPTARHCHHRAVYNFPLSDEWLAWTGAAGNPMKKDDFGEFIEANAKDIMDPTPAITKGSTSDANADFENRLIETAKRIEGRYGQLTELLTISKRFHVYESNELKVVSNRDTGEREIQFLNEHKTADGAPVKIPNLIIIAIPVFKGGPIYRMPVRFRYRTQGGALAFTLTIYNPEKAFAASLRESLDIATEQTDLPLFMGTPEA